MSKWGPHTARYETEQPRKILSLDGGGIRGVITLEILLEMEKQLKKKLGKGDEFRLCQYFDYIGGTSTGAIIATGLCKGMTVQQLLDFYTDNGEKMFDESFLLKKWKSLYKGDALRDMLEQTFGANTNLDLENGELGCLLLIVTMNRTTDSPWPISNNPDAVYNDKSRKDCNLQIKLHQLVRASTAAPVFFPPETLNWDPADPEKTFVFVDGGVTPYNNPAFLMYRMATQPAYKLEWPIGENKLLIVSVGTGSAPSEGEYNNLWGSLKGLPNNLMYTMLVDQDINCRTVGRCTYGAPIDRELRHMIPMDNKGNILDLSQDTKRHFLYVRYNADLSVKGLEEMKLATIDSDDVRKMDSVKHIDDLHTVGRTAAKNQVNVVGHFGSFLK